MKCLIHLACYFQPDKAGRPLNLIEINEARKVFNNLIDYSKVRVFHHKFFALQGHRIIMAPDGNIYWPGETGNLCSCSASTYIHEMMHVYQYQQGVNVITRGLLLHTLRGLSFNHYNPYQLNYQPDKPWQHYNIEQQAEIARLIYLGQLPNIILSP